MLAQLLDDGKTEALKVVVKLAEGHQIKGVGLHLITSTRKVDRYFLEPEELWSACITHIGSYHGVIMLLYDIGRLSDVLFSLGMLPLAAIFLEQENA